MYDFLEIAVLPQGGNCGIDSLTVVFAVTIAIDLGHVLVVVSVHFSFLPIHSCMSHDGSSRLRSH